ncbi:MAG: ABC transporter substrate-binding protein [Chloroflexi bacterium]|nr:ABC transporter substrate-binding protein [Chloroflexota bacterium]
MADDNRDWLKGLNTRLSRRTVLRGGVIGGAGLAAAALIGCGDDDDDEAPAPAPAATQAPAATEAPAATPTATAAAPAATATPTQAAAAEPAEPDYVTQARADGSAYPYNYAEPAGDPKEGGIIKIGVSWDIGAWDISKSQAGGSTTVPDATYNRLIGFKHGPDTGTKSTVDLEPELAHTWEVSPDGLTVNFNLTEGVTYQNVAPINGRPFSSADVLSCFQRQSTEGVNTGAFGLVADMLAPDPNTFQFKLKSPSPDFLIPFGTRLMGIYPHELVDQDLISTNAIGTGPLIVTEAEEGSHVALTKNPDYWEKNIHGREPWLDGLEFRIMGDTPTRVAAYRVGDIDYCYSWPRTPKDAEDLLSTNPDYTVLADPLVLNSGSWGFNLTDPKFADPRVRQALHLGFDRQTTVDIVYGGIGTVLPTAAWPFIFDSSPTFEAGELGPWYKYDPGEAQSLLQAAGQEDLEFDLLTSERYLGLGDNQIMQEQFAALGITVNFTVEDYTAFNALWVPGEYPQAADGWATSSPSPDGFYHAQVHSESPNNRWYINDAEIDAWAEAQQVDLDPDNRKETQRKIWDKVLNEAYRLETVHTFSLSSYPPYLRFVRFSGPYISYHWFYRWGDSFPDTWLDK